MGHEKSSEHEQYWQATVERLLAEAQQTDQEEDQRFGKGKSADSLPEELARAKSRLERIRQAKAELEKEAQEQLQAAVENHTPRKRGRPSKQDPRSQQPRDRQQSAKEKNRLRRAKQNAEQPTRQYNFVDPDSRVMKDNARKCFVQAYNAQIAVDGHAQVIVAAEMTQQTTDREQLLPMVQSVRATTGGAPEVMTAEAGYWDTVSLGDPSLQGIQLLVSPDSKPEPPGALLPQNAPKMKKQSACESCWPAKRERPCMLREKQLSSPCSDRSKKHAAFADSAYVVSRAWPASGNSSVPPTIC